MSAQVETLESFFNYGARASQNAEAMARSPEIRDANAIAAALRKPAGDAVIAAARTLLDDPLYDVIGAAWGKLDDLLRLRDAPAGEINDFVLKDHEIALKRTPSVEIVLSGAPTGVRVPFELKIGLKISSAVLKIRDGRIIGAELGKVHGEGAFSCADVTLAERKTSAVRLPGKLAFTPGVAIG